MMKKIMLFAAACVALAACNKNIDTTSPKIGDATAFEKGQTVTLTVKTGDQTKVTSSLDATTGAVDFKWEAGDTIKVTVGTESAEFTLSEGAGEAAAEFTGTMPAAGDNFDVQYPYTTPDLSSQDYSTTEAIPHNKMVLSANGCSTTGGTVTLTAQNAALRLNLYGTSQTISKIVVKDASSNTYTLNITPAVTLPTAEADAKAFFVVVPTGSYKFSAEVFDNATTPVSICRFEPANAQTLSTNQVLNMPAMEVKKDVPSYLCFEALDAGSTINLVGIMGCPSNILYSTDAGVNWSTLTGAVTLTNEGDKCYFKTAAARNKMVDDMFGLPCKFSGTGDLKVSGNIMALLNGENPATIMTDENAGCFQELFSGCTALTDASQLLLPAATLASKCYYAMFNGCTNLTSAPNLPATDLAANCYDQMFNNCEKLESAPIVSAVSLASGCCANMFKGCASLTVAPALPAETLASCCYQSMFAECSNLTTAPTMSVTSVAENCCDQMFSQCLKLTDASNMSFTAATLASSCFYSMFYNCGELKKAPEMSANAAAFQCCEQMFADCSKLDDVSNITFATTLAEGCYQNMFKGCGSLESVAELPAGILANACYHLMFNGCSKLSSVTMLATGIGATQCLEDWLKDAGAYASTRTVYVAAGMVDDVKATVPDDWKSGVQVRP